MNILLVDKYQARGNPQPRNSPPEKGRYRMVLDCRTINSYCLSDTGWVLDAFYGLNKRRHDIALSQTSALKLLLGYSLEMRKFKAKIDISDAFYQIQLSPTLRNCFGFKINHKEGK